MKDMDDNFNSAVKIYSISDERLRHVGAVLANPKSRLIYELLIDKEYHAREIAKIVENTTNPHLPIIKHHLLKMLKADLITVETRFSKKHGKHLKYYRAVPFLLITPPSVIEKTKNYKTLQKIFKKLYKITSVVIVTGSMLFLSEMSFFVKPLPSGRVEFTLRVGTYMVKCYGTHLNKTKFSENIFNIILRVTSRITFSGLIKIRLFQYLSNSFC